MPPDCHRTPVVGPPAPHAHIPHTAGSNTPPNESPRSRNLPPTLAWRESRANQGNQTFLLVLKGTKATGQAGEGCCPRRDPTSCSRVSPDCLPHRTLERELDPPGRPRRSYSCHRGRYVTEKMSSSSWVTQTLRKGRKLHYCQYIFFQAFKGPKKTRTGAFARWRVREGRSSVTTGLLLPDLRAKKALGTHRNDFFSNAEGKAFFGRCCLDQPRDAREHRQGPRPPPARVWDHLWQERRVVHSWFKTTSEALLVPCSTPRNALACSRGGRSGCRLRRCSPA